MNEHNFISPKEITVSGKTFFIGKIPAFEGCGIRDQLEIAETLKLADHKYREELRANMLKYVGVKLENGNIIRLETPAVINNHVPDAAALSELENACYEYNFGFFPAGVISNALDLFLGRCEGAITQMFTQILAISSQVEKPH